MEEWCGYQYGRVRNVAAWAEACDELIVLISVTPEFDLSLTLQRLKSVRGRECKGGRWGSLFLSRNMALRYLLHSLDHDVPKPYVRQFLGGLTVGTFLKNIQPSQVHRSLMDSGCTFLRVSNTYCFAKD